MNKLQLLAYSFLGANLLNAQTRPNVIILYTDDLGYGDLGCYGANVISTPNVDRLAANGIRFTNGYCTASTCTPSRYSLITGEYAWRKKGTGILPGNAALIIPTGKVTLGTVFQKAGYKTGIVGKWHLGLGTPEGIDWNKDIIPGPNEVGFDYSYIFPATADRVPTVFVENHRVVNLNPEDPIEVSYSHKIGNDPTGAENGELLKLEVDTSFNHRDHAGTIVNNIGRIGWMSGGKIARWVDEELGDVFTAKAKEFIQENKASPFFLYFAIHAIHAPRMPSTRYKGMSQLGLRGDAIIEMDHMVGEIMRELDILGLTKNTMVIFSSDNGPVLIDAYADKAEALARQNNYNPRGPLRGNKYSIFEAGTRVPFIIAWPGHIKRGTVSDAMVSQIDLVASFAGYFGQTLPAGNAGDSENYWLTFLGENHSGRNVVVEEGVWTMAVRQGAWKYIVPQKDGFPLMKRENIETGVSELPQLYDLKNDVGERNNLAGQYPGKVNELRELLEQIKAKPTVR